MTHSREQDRVRRFAREYGTEELAGANEQYHLFLRDETIPEEGGASALEIGCGKGLWSQVLARRYEALENVVHAP